MGIAFVEIRPPASAMLKALRTSSIRVFIRSIRVNI
jgi:hypothetical protein